MESYIKKQKQEERIAEKLKVKETSAGARAAVVPIVRAAPGAPAG
ncbi:hypothetical protein [Rhodoferax saidenbachensis]|nr:hypothetical protein [Rhodoferax saidenbachensis]